MGLAVRLRTVRPVRHPLRDGVASRSWAILSAAGQPEPDGRIPAASVHRPEVDVTQVETGCRPLLVWSSVALAGLGALAFIPLDRTSYVADFLGWLAIVIGSLTVGSCAFSAAVDRIPACTRGLATILGTLAVAAVGAWSLWLLMGPPAVGTLTEAVPLIVDPLAAGAAAVVFSPRSERLPAIAFLVTGFAVAAILVRFVMAVGPTYAG